MKALKHYDGFNFRRYGNPWIAKVDRKTAKPDFSKKVGGYTGGYNKGEAGDLYVYEPEENAVYMYGQKDYRGRHSETAYVIYKNGEFSPVTTENLIKALSGEV